MPWTGSSPNQNFQRTDGTRTGKDTWKDADNAGVKILSSDHDTHDEDIGDGLSACLKKDGGNQATADISMGGFRLTGLGDATADTDALNRVTADGRFLASGGDGVATADIVDDAVTTAKILDDAVTTAKILDANVTEAKLHADLQTLLTQIRQKIGIGAGRLVFSSATELKLIPYNGELISFPDGTQIAIPSGGIAIANTGLAASTVYYAYAFDSTGTLTLELSTTAHATDTTTGVEIKSGDATRVLVGGLVTTAATPGQFADSATQRLVASWHNRRPRQLLNAFTAERTHTSGTFSEVDTEIRCGFFSWGDAVQASYSGSVNNGSGSTWTGISLDGSTIDIYTTLSQGSTAGGQMPANPSGSFIPAEGNHFTTLLAVTNAGTSTYRVSNGQAKLSGTVTI